jgi:DNA-binding transcriptional LysR family regulator
VKLSRLEPFYYVARHRGYTSAAKAMPYPVGEPAVYQQVRRLEHEVGTRLVVRQGTKRLTLTPAGRMLFEFVAPFVEGLGGLERRMGLVRKGTVVIAAPRVVLSDYVAPRLARIKVRVKLVERNAPEDVARLVDAGDADFGLSHFPRIPAALSHLRVGAFEGAAIVPRSHKGSMTLRALLQERFIAYEAGSLPRQILEETLRREKLALAPAIEAPTLDLIMRFVALGLGVSIVPIMSGTVRAIPGIRAVAMRQLFKPFPISLVWRPDGIPVLDEIRQILAR